VSIITFNREFKKNFPFYYFSFISANNQCFCIFPKYRNYCY